MSWAAKAIEDLKRGQSVRIRPRGHSMEPIIRSGETVHVDPVTRTLKAGDIVLATVRGADYLHLVKGVEKNRVQIGNNKGRINGWTPLTKVYGIAQRPRPKATS